MAAKILFGILGPIKGLGVCVSFVGEAVDGFELLQDWNTSRLSHFFARLAKKPSTALSHEADVGVKWKT